MSLTVSLVTQPDTYTTVNAINGSHLYYQAVSASASLPAFQYVFNVYQIDQYAQSVEAFVGQFFAPPRPVTGDGIFTPYRALQSYVNNEPVDFPVNLRGITSASASIVEYQTNYGFSYNPQFQFQTFNLGGKLGLSFSYFPDIKVGDQVSLLMSTNQFNPQYNTTTNIFLTASGGPTFAAGTVLSYGTTPSLPEFGFITNLQRIVATGATAWAWNGTRQYQEQENFFTNYVLTGATNDQFLTNYNNSLFFGPGAPTFSIKPTILGQYETIGFLSSPTSSNNITGITIITFDSSGNQLTNTTHGASGINYPFRKYEIGVGTQNLIDAYGTNFTNCDFYEIILTGAASAEKGWISRRIDNSCQYCFYPNFQLTWLNPRGSYEYYNFYKDSQETINVTTNEIRKVLPWNYTVGARERTILTNVAQSGFKLNTNWITQYDFNWLMKELVIGSEAYLIYQNNQRIPIMITDRQYVAKSYVRDQLFNLTISFEYSSQINIQNN